MRTTTELRPILVALARHAGKSSGGDYTEALKIPFTAEHYLHEVCHWVTLHEGERIPLVRPAEIAQLVDLKVGLLPCAEQERNELDTLAVELALMQRAKIVKTRVSTHREWRLHHRGEWKKVWGPYRPLPGEFVSGWEMFLWVAVWDQNIPSGARRVLCRMHHPRCARLVRRTLVFLERQAEAFT